MLRCFLFLTTIVGLYGQVLAQQPISITAGDLPESGDTFWMSVAANAQSINLDQPGPDQTWDYSGLTEVSQFVDTYQSLSDLPGIYNLLRLQKDVDYGKQEAALLDNLPGSDQIPIDEVLGFYSKESDSYQQAAFGVALLGQDVPVPFQDNDRIYQLPMTYQQRDSSNAFVQFPSNDIPIPGTLDLYFEEARKRVNHVDAWGTLTTPYGTFETLRVRTVVEREDSVSFQGLNQAVEPPDQVLYRWLTKDGGNPVLQVRVQNVGGQEVISNAVYQDSVRNDDNGSPTGIEQASKTGVRVYPNPANQRLKIAIPGQERAQYRLWDISGLPVMQGALQNAHGGVATIDVSALPSGSYVLNLKVPNLEKPVRKRIIVR